MALLNAAEIESQLLIRSRWSLDSGEIVRHFKFPDFATAMIFVNHVAAAAEAADHHPDIDIRYNKVRLALTSHDAGGLTTRDFKLAATIDTLFGEDGN